MPHSLIILENYTDNAAYSFLAAHAEELYELGYEQIFFELYEGYEPSSYMNALKEISQSHKDKSMQPLWKTFTKFKKLNATCRFIDPEHESISLSYQQEMTEALMQKNSLKFEQAYMKQIKSTEERDRIMSETLLKANQNGGIIFVVGYAHQDLIKRLEKAVGGTEHAFRYAVFSHKSSSLENLVAVDLKEWEDLKNASFREKFYGNNKVHHINPKKYSFEMITAMLQLTSHKKCEDQAPSMREAFKEITALPFDFYVDEEHIVSAIADIPASETKQTAAKIKTLFPNLTFFTQKKNQQTCQICVPGTNLPEQIQHIEPILFK